MASVDAATASYDMFLGVSSNMDEKWTSGMHHDAAASVRSSLFLKELSQITEAADHPDVQHFFSDAPGAVSLNPSSGAAARLMSPVTPPALPDQASVGPSPSNKRRLSYSDVSTMPSQPTKKPFLYNFAAGCPPMTKAEQTVSSLEMEPLTPTASPSNGPLSTTHGLSSMVSAHLTNSSAIPPSLNPQAVAASGHLSLGLQPLSPISDSMCSDDENARLGPSALQGVSQQAGTGVALGALPPASPLPRPSKTAAAKRRALRYRALKRSRSRSATTKVESVPDASEEDCVADLSESTQVKKTVDSSISKDDASIEEELGADAQPVDKKIARAIRNRQAAQRSRVEAKAKMQKLADDNEELAVKVEKLQEENKALTQQLEMLLSNSVGPGYDLGDVLTVYNRLSQSAGANSANALL